MSTKKHSTTTNYTYEFENQKAEINLTRNELTNEKPIKTRKSLNYDKKIIQKNKREAVDVKNIIETKRTVKKNSKYSY